MVIAQIEHKDALDSLDEIITVPGLDGFIIGPYDLSCSMGLPGRFDEPQFLQALQYIRDAGTRHGCLVGLHVVEPDVERLGEAIREGYNFIAYSVDIRIIDASVRQGIAAAKEVLK